MPLVSGLCFAELLICFIDQFYFTSNPVVPLLKFSALSEGDQQKTVMAGFPIVLQCELSESTGQVSWYKDGTKLLPQNEVDIQSEGNLRSLVVQSAERAHSGVYRCESKDDDVQFAVEVTGDAQTLWSAFTVLHGQLTAGDYVCLIAKQTFFCFLNLVNYFSKRSKAKVSSEIV